MLPKIGLQKKMELYEATLCISAIHFFVFGNHSTLHGVLLSATNHGRINKSFCVSSFEYMDCRRKCQSHPVKFTISSHRRFPFGFISAQHGDSVRTGFRRRQICPPLKPIPEMRRLPGPSVRSAFRCEMTNV